MIDRERTINRVKVGDIIRYIHRDRESHYRVLRRTTTAQPYHVMIRYISDDGTEGKDEGTSYPVSDLNSNFRKVINLDKERMDSLLILLGQISAFGFIDEAQSLFVELEI